MWDVDAMGYVNVRVNWGGVGRDHVFCLWRWYSFENHPGLSQFVVVDTLYLDSLVEVLTSPVDPIALFVPETVLLEDRWPLCFSDRWSSCLPMLWSVWCLVLTWSPSLAVSLAET